MSSHLALKIVWILISWLLQKPADLDLYSLQEKPADQDPYCLQELIYIGHAVFERINCLSTVRYKLICSFGRVTLSMDKYILAFYLSLDKWQILLFPHPCLRHTVLQLCKYQMHCMFCNMVKVQTLPL